MSKSAKNGPKPLQLSLLGAPQARYRGTLLKFRSRKVFALLIYLVVENRLHHREKLVDIFWPVSEQTQGNATLRSTLARLKKTLAVAGEFLITESGTIGFDFGQGFEVDINYLKEATKSETLSQLEIALENVRGEFLEGFSLKDAPEFDEWTMLQREMWHQRIEQVFERLSRKQVEQGAIHPAVSTASRWVTHSPLTELAYHRLIETQALSGNRSAALQIYERCKVVLNDELSIMPSADLTALIERVRRNETGSIHFSPTHTPAAYAPPSIELPFIGRAREYQQLISLYDQSRDGQPQIAILNAEAGMGKTRLSQAFLNWITVKDATTDILLGKTFEIGGRLPYQPIVEMLRYRLEADNAPEDLLSDVWLAELSQVLPELRDRYPDLPSPLVGDLDLTRMRLFEAVARLCEALAKKRFVVLFIEDLQWADDGSLDLLHYLMRWLHEQKVCTFVLMTLRRENVDTDSQLQEWLDRIMRVGSVHTLTLNRLDPTDLTLLASQLAAKSVPDKSILQFGQWLYSETQGQPFFMAEMLQMLVQRNLIIYRSDMQEPKIDITASLALIKSAEGLTLPPTIRDLILARLKHMSETASAVLLAGAVIGRELSFDMLTHVSGLSEEVSLHSLETVLKHRLLVEKESNQQPYTFSHDKIRDIVYTQASEARRQIYHRRALVFLIQARASAAELAFHAFAANQFVDAFQYSLIAGEDALKTYALSDALMHFEQAHAIYKQVASSAEDILQLYRQWGRALELSNQFEQSISIYTELASIGKQYDNQKIILVSLISQAILYATPTPINDPNRGENLASEALKLARHLGEHEIEARALWSMLLVHHYGLGDAETAYEYGELALHLARRYNLEEMLAYVLNDLNWVCCARGDIRRAHQYVKDAITAWRKLGNTSMLLDSLNGASLIHSLSGEFELAEATAREGIELANTVNNVWNQISIEGNLLWVYRERGQYDLIIRALTSAIEYAEETLPSIAPYYKSSLALIYADLGMGTRSNQLCDEIVEQVTSTPVFWRLSDLIHAVRAYLKIQEHDLVGAEMSLQEIQLDTNTFNIATVMLIAPSLKCQLALAQAEFERVVEVATDFITTLEDSGVQVGLAEAHYYKAQGLLALEEFNSAQVVLAEAIQIAEGLQARRLQWLILLSMSQIESRLGNEDESRQLHKDARIILEEIIEHIPNNSLRKSFCGLAEVRSLLY